MSLAFTGSTTAGDWVVERVAGSANDLHRTDPFADGPVGRTVWLCCPDDEVLVLGSRQRTDDVIEQPPGLSLAQRRTGGGAVMVGAGDVWVDVMISRSDPLWSDDVGAAFLWLGEVWRRAATALGHRPTVHTGRLETGEWGDRVCFASRGTGEVFDRSGAKLVGVSQRRTRAGARFQCSALLVWDPEPYVQALIAPAEQNRARAELAALAAPIATDRATVIDAFVEALATT